MILLLVATAAADWPWDCPTFTVPADAYAAVHTESGLADHYAALHDAAMAYWDDGCAWMESSTSDYSSSWTERVCEGADATVTYTELVEYSSYPDVYDTTSTLVVEPTAETWTSISLTWGTSSTSYSSETYGGSGGRSAAWAGSFDGLPDDGWFRYGSGGWSTGATQYDYAYHHTPDCSFSWSWEHGFDSDQLETVTANGSEVEIVWAVGAVPTCSADVYYGSVDGVMAGAVDPDTWALDPADTDHDGTIGDDDCDDTDPDISCLGDDIPNDGIDQDCFGGDHVDWDLDGDGHDDVGFGGDDCDDGHRGIYPGGDDAPGDGIDQDCDGADDVDADGDGFTADGDDLDADCDDTDNHIYPGRPDTPYDGVDEDCDGADVTDYDGDGEDAAEVGGPDCDDADYTVYSTAPEVECDGIDQDCDGADECPPPVAEAPEEEAEEEERAPVEEEAVGCAGGAALLLFAPLALRRRRR